MLPTQIRKGLKANLESIKGMRVYELIPTPAVAPCAIVGQLNFTFDLANTRGLDQADLDVVVLVQRFSERSGQNDLDKYLQGSGDYSIKAAIESDLTLGGACSTLRVTSAEAGTYSSGDIEFLSYRYRLTVYGQGE
jgi:hypothetical protein